MNAYKKKYKVVNGIKYKQSYDEELHKNLLEGLSDIFSRSTQDEIIYKYEKSKYDEKEYDYDERDID